MRPSIKHHIYRQFFTLSLLTSILLVSLVIWMSSDLEENVIALEIKQEQTHYLSQISDVAQTWETETYRVIFLPKNDVGFYELPRVFHTLSIPFSGEINLQDKEYWVEIRPVPTGVLYVAKDISLFEEREEVFLLGVLIISGSLFIVFSFVLTQLSARRIIKPLIELTQEINRINPEHRNIRVSDNYRDQELHSIAKTFNTYLDTMEAYVKREHMLIGMASHELRTPTAIISGALDVLDERGTMSEADKKTVGRIRDATDEMNANVKAILMLVRKQSRNDKFTRISLSQSIQTVVQGRLSVHPDEQMRLSIIPSETDHTFINDSTLILMLLRNLIHNALDHTQGNVILQQNEKGLIIQDEGVGLPETARLQLAKKMMLPTTTHANESGLGLFIVTLICERLGWKIEVIEQAGEGTHLQLIVT